MIIQWQTPLLKLFPVQVFRSFSLYFHGYAIINRTNQLAKVAAHTFFFFYGIGIIRFAVRKVDGLV